MRQAFNPYSRSADTDNGGFATTNAAFYARNADVERRDRVHGIKIQRVNELAFPEMPSILFNLNLRKSGTST